MTDINRVTLVGALDRDPEITTMPTGRQLTKLRVATIERWQGRDGQPGERTEWTQVAAWGATGIAVQGLRQGDRVRVEGRLQTRSYDKNGEKRYATEVVAASIIPEMTQPSLPGTTEVPPSKHTTRYVGSMHSADNDDIPF
jgi:single-strand DNA-binding protein